MTSFLQIQTFIEVARRGSFAEAAQRLALPRSTVSARIRALEDRLETRLLHRTTRQATLTEEGRRYLEQCEEVMSRLAEIETRMRSDRIVGAIRITVPVDMSKPRLARALARFVDSHPEVSIEVIVTDEALDLVAHRIDLALRGGAPGAAGLVARRLGEGRLALYATRRYVDQHLSAGPIHSLDGHALFDPTRRGQHLNADPERTPIHTRSFELAKSLALLSRGVALLPTSLCEEEVRTGQLVEVPVAEPLPKLMVYVVLPTREHLPARVRALVDFLVSGEESAKVMGP